MKRPITRAWCPRFHFVGAHLEVGEIVRAEIGSLLVGVTFVIDVEFFVQTIDESIVRNLEFDDIVG